MCRNLTVKFVESYDKALTDKLNGTDSSIFKYADASTLAWCAGMSQEEFVHRKALMDKK